jgi:hypothetical protein
VPAFGKRANIDTIDADFMLLDGPADNPVPAKGRHHIRKNRQNGKPHGPLS